MAETAYNLAIEKIEEGFRDLGEATKMPFGELEINYPRGSRHYGTHWSWLSKPQDREYRIEVNISLDERSA